MSPPRLGWLFAYDWDARAMHALRGSAGHAFDHAGFDLFAFPSNAALIGFDLARMARRQADRGRRLRWRGVLSHHEQFGALAAALVAERLGLPGARPEAILAAQHKLHARRVLERVAPEANLPFAPLDARYGEDVPEGLDYPCYVKPVKAAFSVLAARMDDRDALQAHTRFGRREGWVIRRLVEPFERVCRERLPEAGSAHRMMLEAPVPMQVPQYNLDGWVFDGQVHALGVVDAVMMPGTQAFLRWEVPSRLAQPVQARALDIARRFLAAIGFDHGFFNLEFFHDPLTDRLSVIECNPRLASQFGDLHQRVSGADAHAMAVAMALGDDPRALPRAEPTAGAAASLVYRTLPGQAPPPQPRADRLSAFARTFPDGLQFGFPKSGSGLARDYKWTGSHRYGIVHLGGRDAADLRRRGEQASALLGWPAPWHDAPAAVPAASISAASIACASRSPASACLASAAAPSTSPACASPAAARAPSTSRPSPALTAHLRPSR